MAYRAYQPDRRTRWRRWLLILLTLVLVVVAVAWLVSRQTEQRGTADFLASAEEASQLNDEAATLYQETLADLGPLLSRQEVTRRLADITATAERADALLTMDVPTVVAGPAGAIATASRAWREGTAETERVILGIMDGEIVTGAEAALRATIDALRVGDTGYGLFLDEVGALPEGIDVPTFAAIRYVDPDPSNPALYDAQNLVLRIQAAYNLAPRHDVAVIGMVDPAPTGERGGIPVVPFSDEIAINLVVSNLGNEDEASIDVVLDILDVDTGETQSFPTAVNDLAAGASTTVVFDDLGIEPGGLYQASASVTIDDDNRPDNNAWSMTFIWNAAS